MTRAERNEYNYIKKNLKLMIGFTADQKLGTQLTIRTDAGHEYKQALHELYTSLGFHPASVKVDTHWFDDKERIIYISGQTWFDDAGNEHSWSELYTYEEKERFAAALQ